MLRTLTENVFRVVDIDNNRNEEVVVIEMVLCVLGWVESIIDRDLEELRSIVPCGRVVCIVVMEEILTIEETEELILCCSL